MNEYDLSDAVTETVAGALYRNLYSPSNNKIVSNALDAYSNGRNRNDITQLWKTA